MNRKLTLILIALSLIFLIGGVYAADIAYVVKSTSRVNSDITTVMNEIGYSYQVVTESQISSTNFSQYRLVLVGNDIFQNPSRIPVNEHNSLIFNQYHYYKKGTTDFQWGWAKDQGILSRSILNLNNNNNVTITQGLPSQFTAYNAGGVNAYILSGQKPIGITYVTYSGNPSNGDYVVALAQPNTLMLNGNRTVGRSLFFGLVETDFWTADTRKLFKNSLEWSIKGQDKDQDGFFDNDCNDNNASINPNGTEIAYNRVDENCDKFDLADVDGDGYCKAGYLIMNKTLQCANEGITSSGSDCDDNNAEINKGSSDLLNNCINDAPKQILNISDIEWVEDSDLSLSIDNIRSSFSDPESSSNNLSVIVGKKTGNNISVSFNSASGMFIFTNVNNWNGDESISFNVSDGENVVESNIVKLKVLPVNDNPILQSIQDEYVLSGRSITIIPNASDVDGDNLTFSFSSPLNSNGSWSTSDLDIGEYNIDVSVSDGLDGIDEKSFMLTVMAKALINEFSSNNGNDWIELYNPGNTQIILDGCSINNSFNSFAINGSINPKSVRAFDINSLVENNGSIELSCNGEVIDSVSYGHGSDSPGVIEGKSIGRIQDALDNDLATDFVVYDLPTKNLLNGADMISPIINLINQNNLTINERNINLEFNVTDNSVNVTCELYTDTSGSFSVLNLLNGIFTNGIFSGNFSLSNIPDGNYLWNVRCNDGTNYVFAPQNKTFIVSAPDAPVLTGVGNKFVTENQTLEFEIDASDIDNDSIEYSAENLPQGSSFNNRTFSWIPNFNQSGIYNLRFLVKDSTNLSSYEDIQISVSDFKLPPEFNAVGASAKCNVKDSRVVLDITKPSVSKLEIGDEFEVRVKVRNNLNDDTKFELKGYLYDLTTDKIIDDKNVKVSVDKGKSEDSNFTLEIPTDLEETSDNYAIYVYARSSDNECNSVYKEVRIERKRDSLLISKFDIVPDEQNPGNSVTMKVKVENAGSRDQDAYIEIKNSELGINIKSEEFEIAKYGDKDTITKSFSFTIPENISNGEYEIKTKVYYEGLTAEKTKKITISSNIPNANSNTETIVEDNGNTRTYSVDNTGVSDGNTRTYVIITTDSETGETTTYSAASILNDSDESTFKYVDTEKEPIVVSVDNIKLGSGRVLSVYNEDVDAENVKGNLMEKAQEYTKDPMTKSLLYVLNVLLIIGILTFVICLAYIARRRM